MFFQFDYSRIVFFKFDHNLIMVICVFYYCFGNHTAVLDVLHEMTEKSKKRINKLLGYTYYSQVIVYLLIMLIGYLSNYEKTSDLIIDDPNQSVFLVLGKAAYTIALLCNVGLYYLMQKSTFEWIFKNNKNFTKFE